MFVGAGDSFRELVVQVSLQGYARPQWQSQSFAFDCDLWLALEGCIRVRRQELRSNIGLSLSFATINHTPFAHTHTHTCCKQFNIQDEDDERTCVDMRMHTHI